MGNYFLEKNYEIDNLIHSIFSVNDDIRINLKFIHKEYSNIYKMKNH